ncbi:Squalene synthase 1-like protein [Gossypium australe]|uniref:Squalene synthase 1-like protein n=1 Tax=Gossypium australe TaxID=47621 RepID=A0A5B6WLN0_9ROSI|nr:Squalene synthase 1-like protein [Gossypium australe]
MAAIEIADQKLTSSSLSTVSFAVINKWRRLGTLAWEIVEHPSEFYPLLKLKLTAMKEIPLYPQQWRFCFSVLYSLTSFAFVITLIHSYEFKKAVSILFAHH